MEIYKLLRAVFSSFYYLHLLFQFLFLRLHLWDSSPVFLFLFLIFYLHLWTDNWAEAKGNDHAKEIILFFYKQRLPAEAIILLEIFSCSSSFLPTFFFLSFSLRQKWRRKRGREAAKDEQQRKIRQPRENNKGLMAVIPKMYKIKDRKSKTK